MYLGTNGHSSLYIDGGNANNVYIGLTGTAVSTIRAELKNKYKLFVNKGILAEDYSIAPKSSWSDFVFDAGYQLKNINELEAFIAENKGAYTLYHSATKRDFCIEGRIGSYEEIR